MVDEWYRNKKKTYHKCWETQVGWAWCLFFTDDAITGNYHTGIEDTEKGCEKQIKWGIAAELRRRELL